MIKTLKISIFLLFLGNTTFASDSLSVKSHNKKLYTVLGSEAAIYAVGYTGLNYLWYADYPRSSFHFFNDGNEWLQMDKCGHSYSTYWIARGNYKLFKWANLTDKQATLSSLASSWLFISTIEVFDGFSSEYGASPEDLIANTAGASLFGLQQYFWNEQKIIYKFSYYPSQYAKLRPDALGATPVERLLKDYNAQIYWLSTGLRTITGIKTIPEWLNLAIGYGADGMTGAENNKGVLPESKRIRQFYISFDINTEKIKSKNSFVKFLLLGLNCIKVPLPTIEFNKNNTKVLIR